MNKLEINNNSFETIKHVAENGNEYWLARELQIALDYKKWQKFINVIENVKTACDQSKFMIEDHFTQVGKMVDIGSKTLRSIVDFKLSRYACYLIVQNANPKFKAVSLGQTYFAIQTRKMELTEIEYSKLSEDEKRLYRIKQTKDGNKILYKIASEKGVKNFDKFTNAGYKRFI